MNNSLNQSTLFGSPMPHPEGFRYETGLIDEDEEKRLMDRFATIPLVPYVYEGYEAKRRIAYFGMDHDFETGALRQTENIPDYLVPLQKKAAAFAGISPDGIVHALVTEYMPGTPIGWHRDSPPFDKVIGVSFGSACPFRMRKEIIKDTSIELEGENKTKENKTKWERFSQTVEPRSIYIMEGPARYVWQHSIPPLTELRYSVTFRTVR